MESQTDLGSRLSHLPVEIVVKIYKELVKLCADSVRNEGGGVYASVVANVTFPKYTGVQCNMMPIVIGDMKTIPKNMRQYMPLLATCPISR